MNMNSEDPFFMIEFMMPDGKDIYADGSAQDIADALFGCIEKRECAVIVMSPYDVEIHTKTLGVIPIVGVVDCEDTSAAWHKLGAVIRKESTRGL